MYYIHIDKGEMFGYWETLESRDKLNPHEILCRCIHCGLEKKMNPKNLKEHRKTGKGHLTCSIKLEDPERSQRRLEQFSNMKKTKEYRDALSQRMREVMLNGRAAELVKIIKTEKVRKKMSYSAAKRVQSSNKRFKKKDYLLPSGNIIKIQGYENYGLEKLFSEGYREEDIVIESTPIIEYMDDSKVRHYKPDFYIPSENLIIEIKSPYTWNVDLSTNLNKIRGAIDNNYKFRLIIIDPKTISIKG